MPVLWIIVGTFAGILVLSAGLELYVKKTKRNFIPDRRRNEKDQAHLNENDPRRKF